MGGATISITSENVASLLGEQFWLLTRKKSVKEGKKNPIPVKGGETEPRSQPFGTLEFRLLSSTAETESYFGPEICAIRVYVSTPEVRKSPLKAPETLWDPVKAIPL